MHQLPRSLPPPPEFGPSTSRTAKKDSNKQDKQKNNEEIRLAPAKGLPSRLSQVYSRCTSYLPSYRSNLGDPLAEAVEDDIQSSHSQMTFGEDLTSLKEKEAS